MNQTEEQNSKLPQSPCEVSEPYMSLDHDAASQSSNAEEVLDELQCSSLSQSSIDLTTFKVIYDDIEVEYNVSMHPAETAAPGTAASEQIQAGLNRIEHEIQATQDQLDVLNHDIDRLTNHADHIDNIVAVGSGLLAGLIDAFWIGEFNFERGMRWSNKTVNEFVMKMANKNGYTGKRLDGAIRKLEELFKIPSDNIFNGKNVGIGAKSHHLDDLSHHPTPIGLFFSILTQFTKTGYFQNGEGTFLPIDVDEKGLELIGTDIPSKLFCGTINWFFHLVSDMSGSNKTAGVGMGIPGPIVSLLKELSIVPGFDKSGLPQKLKEVFVKEKFDLRAEMAVLHELGRQAVPVMINEVLVRTFFFIRRLVTEVKTKRSLKDIEWKKILPWNNRTMTRMLTIATGTFTAVDLADAAIRAGLKSGGNPVNFGAQLILHVNFVGVGRFAVAVYSDVSKGSQCERLRDARITLLSQQLHWANAKVAYLQGNVWQAAEHTEISLRKAEQMMSQSAEIFISTWEDNRISLYKISHMKKRIQEHNPQLISEIQTILKWG